MNTEAVIGKYYEAFNQKNWHGMLSLLSEDVLHDINQGGTEKGKDVFQKFLGVMDEHYDEKVTDLVVFTKDGRGSAEFYIEGYYKKTQAGLPPAKNQFYKLRVGAFFDVKNGLITRITNYYNLPLWTDLVSK